MKKTKKKLNHNQNDKYISFTRSQNSAFKSLERTHAVRYSAISSPNGVLRVSISVEQQHVKLSNATSGCKPRRGPGREQKRRRWLKRWWLMWTNTRANKDMLFDAVDMLFDSYNPIHNHVFFSVTFHSVVIWDEGKKWIIKNEWLKMSPQIIFLQWIRSSDHTLFFFFYCVKLNVPESCCAYYHHYYYYYCFVLFMAVQTYFIWHTEKGVRVKMGAGFSLRPGNTSFVCRISYRY